MKNTNKVPGKEAWSLQRAAKDASVKSGSPLGLEISLSCFSRLDSHNSPSLHSRQSKSHSFANKFFLPKARITWELPDESGCGCTLPSRPVSPGECERQGGRSWDSLSSGAPFPALPGTDGGEAEPAAPRERSPLAPRH